MSHRIRGLKLKTNFRKHSLPSSSAPDLALLQLTSGFHFLVAEEVSLCSAPLIGAIRFCRVEGRSVHLIASDFLLCADFFDAESR